MRGREALGRGVVTAIDVARRLRSGTREAERHFHDGLRFRAAAAQWGEDERRAWQLQALRDVVRRAARETPFYRDRFRAVGFDPAVDFSFDDYARLPILEREDVHAHQAAMHSPSVPAHDRRRDGTGGSTGVPLQYVSGPEERGWRNSGPEHYMALLGVPRGASTAFLWGHHLDRQARTEWRERLRDAVTNRRWYDCFRLSPEILLGYHHDMERYRPAALVAYASALDALASVLLERGLRAGYPVRRVVTGAEKLWGHQRERAQQVFAAPIHERYGSREAGLIGMQLDAPRSLAFEVDFANAFVEPETDRPDSEILLTKLHADAMPMLRYRMGDVARFPAGSRPGHPALRLEEVLGRRLDRLVLPDGRWLHGVGIPHLMKDFPLREFQIRQGVDYSVEVLIVPGEGFEEHHGREILGTLGDNLPGLDMRLTPVDAVPRGGANKWHPVISLVAGEGERPVATPSAEHSLTPSAPGDGGGP